MSAPDVTESLVLEAGKYEFRRVNNVLTALRHGEPWRDFTGDKAINALFDAALTRPLQGPLQDWLETAAQFQRNAEFYHGIVTEIGEMFGTAAKTSDDGSIQDSVLALKVPELVRAALAPPPEEAASEPSEQGLRRDRGLIIADLNLKLAKKNDEIHWLRTKLAASEGAKGEPDGEVVVGDKDGNMAGWHVIKWRDDLPPLMPGTKVYLISSAPTEPADTREIELLRELAAGKCVISKVIAELGPLSLWSKAGLEREIARRTSPAPTEPQAEGLRRFKEWLDQHRDANVSEVFHDICERYSASLSASATSGTVGKDAG